MLPSALLVHVVVVVLQVPPVQVVDEPLVDVPGVVPGGDDAVVAGPSAVAPVDGVAPVPVEVCELVQGSLTATPFTVPGHIPAGGGVGNGATSGVLDDAAGPAVAVHGVST